MCPGGELRRPSESTKGGLNWTGTPAWTSQLSSANWYHMIQKGHVAPTATSCHPLTKAERFCRKFGNFSTIIWLCVQNVSSETYFVIYIFIICTLSFILLFCYRCRVGFFFFSLFYTFERIFSLTRGWTWLAMLWQYLGSPSAVEQPAVAIRRTKHGQAKNWPKVTTYDRVHQIFIAFCTWFRRGVLWPRL